jgi:hypothetical protein
MLNNMRNSIPNKKHNYDKFYPFTWAAHIKYSVRLRLVQPALKTGSLRAFKYRYKAEFLNSYHTNITE